MNGVSHMGNLDFSGHPGFSWYVVLLIISGVAMLGLAAAFPSRPLHRGLNGVFGLGFVGYGIYLAFIFSGGTYVIFFKAFILPVVLIASTIRARVGARQGRAGSQAGAVRPAPPSFDPPVGDPVSTDEPA